MSSLQLLSVFDINININFLLRGPGAVVRIKIKIEISIIINRDMFVLNVSTGAGAIRLELLGGSECFLPAIAVAGFWQTRAEPEGAKRVGAVVLPLVYL